jgi:4-oxalocrotonate tautomerase
MPRLDLEFVMPLIRISMRRGRPASHPAAIVDGVYRALRSTFEVPENDLFAVVHQHDADEFVFDANYFGFQRSSGLVIIQLFVANTRGVTQKKALYAAIAENLMREPGLKPDDIFINLVEVKREDWSFGGGIAQYVA